jgi:hypothetical protein
MALDFIHRLLRTNDELVKCVKWTIENDKQDCAALLQPIARAFADILAEMINMEQKILKRRRKISLVKKRCR